MKKLFTVCLVVMMLILGGCGPKEEKPDVYTVKKSGKDYTVNTVEKTVLYRQTEYEYELRQDSRGYSIRIDFPDGSYYIDGERYDEGMSSSVLNLSMDFDLDNWELASGMYEAVSESVDKPVKNSDGNQILYMLVAVGLFAIGMWCVISPESSWKFHTGRWYKNLEPSELALKWERIGGGVMAILAIVLFMNSCR